MNHSNTRFIHFAGSSIKVEVDSPKLLDAIDAHFAHCLGVEENVEAEYQVRAAAKREPLYSIQKNGEDFRSDIKFEQVLFQLMQDGLTALNGAAKSDMIFHAAGLAQNDRGLLMCGKSGSGKTTLTAWLTAHGFDYLSDEVIAYPPDGGDARGFCRSLVLKKGSASIWERWLENGDGYLKMEDGSVWVTPTLLNPSAPRERVEPRMILFPKYTADAEFETERLTLAGGVFQLMQTLVNARNFSDHGMGAVKALAQNVPAYRLVYSDIDQATEWIKKTLAA